MPPTKAPPQEKNIWEDVRETVISGLKDWKDRGDELARQGRIRMDELQTERRLRSAHEALGAKCSEMLTKDDQITAEHPVISQLCDRVRYYQDELTRLRSQRMTHTEA